MFAVKLHRPSVGVTSFIHQARPRRTARFDVHRRADFLRPGMLFDENAGAEEPRFFAVVDQKNYGILRSGKRFIGARHFEHGRRATAAGGAPPPPGPRIVMRGEESRRSRRTAIETRDYVFDRRAAAIFIAGKP